MALRLDDNSISIAPHEECISYIWNFRIHFPIEELDLFSIIYLVLIEKMLSQDGYFQFSCLRPHLSYVLSDVQFL